MSIDGTSPEWQVSLRLKLETLIDELVVDGIAHDEVLDAVIAETAILREAFARDPDPAEELPNKDTIEEPANDWPSAV